MLRARQRLACFTLMLGLCLLPECKSPSPKAILDRIPTRIGDFLLVHEDAGLGIYAVDRDSALGLASSIPPRVAQLCDGIGPSRGIVFALASSADDAFAQVEKCAIAGVREARGFPDTRSYCLSDEPYFSESFGLDVDCLKAAGLLSGFSSPPDWSCALTTDALFREGVARRLSEMVSASLSIPREVPPEALLLSAPAIPLMLAIQGWIALRYAGIDFELMRLQREEVIRLACASSRKVDPVVRHKKVGVIEADIEARWHAIWSSRPVD